MRRADRPFRSLGTTGAMGCAGCSAGELPVAGPLGRLAPPLRVLALAPALIRPPSASLAFVLQLATSMLLVVALLVLVSSLIWRRHRARTTGEPDRLRPFLLNGALAIPTLTAWLTWLLARLAPLNLADRLLVAFALAWMLAPFTALALSAAGEALTRNRSR